MDPPLLHGAAVPVEKVPLATELLPAFRGGV